MTDDYTGPTVAVEPNRPVWTSPAHPANVGWIGLGKLGFTCAAVLADRGHLVTGYDVKSSFFPPDEAGLEKLDVSTMAIASSPADVVAAADLVFVAVQTPHAAQYGGERLAPTDRRDFEYGYLVDAVRSLTRAAADQRKRITVVVVSTVLPGTCNRLIRPLLNEWTRLVYNPFFIAMGTTIADFTHPEMVLIGADDPADSWPLEALYRGIHYAPFARMSIESAELAKVAYNVFISQKIVFANTLMEICHKTGADCDDVVDALELATDRVVSAKYLRGGMGDGGHCHPRDLIAMSWLAKRLDLSFDLLGSIAHGRERQTAWLAQLVDQWCETSGLEPAVLGKSYKPESRLTGGSPALLLAHLLGDPEIWDPYVDGFADGLAVPEWTREPRVFVVATRHPMFAEWGFPVGSVVIDPWGYIPDRPGVTVVRVGRKS